MSIFYIGRGSSSTTVRPLLDDRLGVSLNDIVGHYGTTSSRKSDGITYYKVLLPKGYYVIQFDNIEGFLPHEYRDKLILVENLAITDWHEHGIWITGQYLTASSSSKRPMNIVSLDRTTSLSKFYKVTSEILDHIDKPELWETFKDSNLGGIRRRRRHRTTKRNQKKKRTTRKK